MANQYTYKDLTCSERFNLFVERIENQCWLWKGEKDSCGYGRFKYNRKYIYGHRFSYELIKGLIPNGMCVCHSCDNPSCVNPDHLWLGTHQENMNDMYKKKRRPNGYQKFTRHPHSKLTNSQVIQIREMLADGWKQVDIARCFGVKRQIIGNIKGGTRYAGVS